MKKILLAAMAMLFAMNMTAQNTQTISQEIRNSFRNGKPVFSKEIQAMDKAMHEGKAGEVFGEMYLTDLASSSECSVDRISIVSLSNVTSSSAKAVVKVIENCPDEKSSYQYDMNLIKEDGKWVIDDYNQMKEHVLKTFREHGIKYVAPLMFSDLLSIYNNRQNRAFANQLLTSKGYKAKDGGWEIGNQNNLPNITIKFDRGLLSIEGVLDMDNDEKPLSDWRKEFKSMGYKETNSYGHGGSVQFWYSKNGLPNINYSQGWSLFHFVIGE